MKQELAFSCDDPPMDYLSGESITSAADLSFIKDLGHMFSAAPGTLLELCENKSLEYNELRIFEFCSAE
jgi:hypothetical protein